MWLRRRGGAHACVCPHSLLFPPEVRSDGRLTGHARTPLPREGEEQKGNRDGELARMLKRILRDGSQSLQSALPENGHHNGHTPPAPNSMTLFFFSSNTSNTWKRARVDNDEELRLVRKEKSPENARTVNFATAPHSLSEEVIVLGLEQSQAELLLRGRKKTRREICKVLAPLNKSQIIDNACADAVVSPALEVRTL